MQRSLTHNTEHIVKFSEADPLGIVWHGHYIRYFEDAREAFGAAYGIRYLDLYHQDIVVPIVKVHCDYKRLLRYGHSIRIEVTYKDSLAAKMLFDYTIYDMETNEKVATGSTVQVFMDKETMEMLLTVPDFMRQWKEKWLTQN